MSPGYFDVMGFVLISGAVFGADVPTGSCRVGVINQEAAGSLTPWVWAAAPLVLIGAVVIASILPVRRALAVDPLTILRDS